MEDMKNEIVNENEKNDNKALAKTWAIWCWSLLWSTPILVALASDNFLLILVSMAWACIVCEITRKIAPNWIRRAWEVLTEDAD